MCISGVSQFEHRRFYFPVEEKRKERSVVYRPPNMARSERLVAWEPKRKSTGEGKGFWWHLAARLRFEQMSDDQWCLSIRASPFLLSRRGEEKIATSCIAPF